MNAYEFHKKSCSLIKNDDIDNNAQYFCLGFFDTGRAAAKEARKYLSEHGIDETLLNGCALCCKSEYHRE